MIAATWWPCATPRVEKAERMAAEWGVPRVYADLEGLLADADVDGSTVGFRGSSRHFVDALLAGFTPDMTGEMAVKALQLCFAVYQASNTREPVDPSTITGSVSPVGWPPSPDALRREAMQLLDPDSVS